MGTIVGVAVGIGASFGLTRLLAKMLYEVSAHDSITFAGCAVLLASVALAASCAARPLAVQQAIKYFSYWDVPRTFALEQAGKVYVLSSEFDDQLDE